ncbi:TonB-dependent receptor domain-containing protein [Novosphingobium album (ex Hu et al. 2023)]|uniref:TonB-dependent receptor n=1 Tax=Novosphingobium album (ex Hu et al. 2023) TaxID=2930093 RepID=A0ABT0AWU0_9SPHN|nr:TonB-dependent receptor [Novosphingobium album (ex Hu et al. 2023)]MCJ2177237.1 TonB-dependent receptor [Novosphingobium album (ex Hu et al. 2023)]
MKSALMRTALRGATCLSAATLVVSVAGTANAQDSAALPAADETADATDTIIVTGSRLGTEDVRAQPVSVLTGQAITQQGYTNVGQALTALPSFGVPGNSVTGSQGTFGAGQTFVNLYNLGAQRTLTLINGNRFVSAGTSSIFGAVQGSPVDLAQIAPDLVDRIDVVSVGGAPIYGSDAIAGTVNVILKKDYQGISLTGSSGISEHGDARDYNASLLIGQNFDGGRGNITVNVYYDHQNGLTTAARKATNGDKTFFGTDPSGQYTYARFDGGLHYSIFTNTGLPAVVDSVALYGGGVYAGFTDANGNALYFNKAGQLTSFQNGTPLANGITEAGGDGFAINDYSNLLTQSQRIQGTALANYEFSDHLRFHGEFWLGRNQASNLADQPYYSTYFFGPAGSANGNLILSTSNPFLSAADQATLQSQLAAYGLPTDTFYMARANTDLSTGAFKTTTTLWRVVGGLDGDFSVGDHDFTWDATVNYGHITSHTKSRELVTQNFFNALDAVTDGSGNIICNPGYTSATIATISSTCAPLNIFGYGNASQASLDYVTALSRTRQVNTQLDIVADVKGDLLTLPAGKVQAALGYEHRRESQSFDPGLFYTGELQADGSYAGYGNSVPIDPVSGAYHTDEIFGEMNVPVVSSDMHLPAIYRLDLNGAGRYTKNSLTGGNWSYTFGGSYAPIKDIAIRGNYTHSFRAPSVTELFAPSGSVYELANDPCDARFINDGPNPSVRAANCAAEGLPGKFVTADNPNGLSYISEYSQLGTGGGNRDLENEYARSWTVGAVLTPTVLPGLRITSDYVSIDVSNEITSPGVEALLAACYDSADYPNFFACDTFTRDATGQIVDFTDDYFNIAIEKFRALQSTLSYALPLNKLGLPDGAGMLNLSANWLHTFKHYYRVGTSDQQLVLDSYTDPKDAVTGNIDWQTKDFDWNWQVIYYGPSKIDPNAADSAYEYPNMSAYWMVNTSIGIKANENFDLRLIVNNVFNLGIPSPYTSYSASKYYDALMGRYFRMNATVKF